MRDRLHTVCTKDLLVGGDECAVIFESVWPISLKGSAHRRVVVSVDEKLEPDHNRFSLEFVIDRQPRLDQTFHAHRHMYVPFCHEGLLYQGMIASENCRSAPLDQLALFDRCTLAVTPNPGNRQPIRAVLSELSSGKEASKEGCLP